MAQRRQHRRSLRFESLETRQSLTSIVGVTAAVEGVQSEYSSATSQANRLLLYVAAFSNQGIERELPDQSDADSVDRWIEHASPDE